MALYDRDYAKNQQLGATEGLSERGSLSVFIKRTYQLFAASLLSGSVGAYLGMDIVGQLVQYRFAIFVLEIALLIGLLVAKRKTGLNYILLFAFTFVSGLTLSFVLARYLQAGAGGIVVNAFILTTVAFGALSVFAMNTKKDFSAWGKMLFIVLIVVIAAMILNIFVESTIMSLAVSSACVVLFSAFILYDTQNIIKGAYETPIEGAIALYLDFLNLFIHLLNILGIFNRE